MKQIQFAGGVLALALTFGADHANAANVTLNAGGASSAFSIYTQDFAAITASKATNLFSYEAAGSGAGQKAFLLNNIGYFEPVSASNSIGYAAGTLTYGAIVGKEVDFGASDAYLTPSQLTNAATGSYGTATEGSAVDGPLIQLPALGVATALAYNLTTITGNALKLTDAQICGVLSGKITDWHSINSKIAKNTPISVVVRSDSAGTTFLLTQHLSAVCTSANSSFPEYPVPVTKYFYNTAGSSSPVFPSGLPSNFIGESGNGGLAKQLVATSNSIGYLSPDYTDIAPSSPNTTSLQVATVVNALNGKAYLPTIANTALGLNNPAPGSTNSNPPATLSAAHNPLNWVPVISETSEGYPLVGYTTIEASTCYANSGHAKLLVTFLKDLLEKSGSFATITANSGFVPLQKTKSGVSYYAAVQDDFISNISGYNLNIGNATACAGYAGR